MKVCLVDIKQAFDSIINKTKSRADVANWAAGLMYADDDDELEFEPQDAVDKIRQCIGYLMGVDLLDIDGSNLHIVEDFIQYRTKKGL